MKLRQALYKALAEYFTSRVTNDVVDDVVDMKPWVGVSPSQPLLPALNQALSDSADPADATCTYCGGVHLFQCPHCSVALQSDGAGLVIHKHHCSLART